MSVINQARQNFVIASDAQVDFNDLPNFGNRWSVFCDVMKKQILSFSSVTEAINWAQIQGNFDHREPVGPDFASKVQTYINVLRYEYPEYSDKILEFSEYENSVYLQALQGGGANRAKTF